MANEIKNLKHDFYDIIKEDDSYFDFLADCGEKGWGLFEPSYEQKIWINDKIINFLNINNETDYNKFTALVYENLSKNLFLNIKYNSESFKKNSSFEINFTNNFGDEYNLDCHSLDISQNLSSYSRIILAFNLLYHNKRAESLDFNKLFANPSGNNFNEKNKLILSKLNLLPDETNIKFEDIFDLNQIQNLQDLFADMTGLASLITDTQGNPITQPTNFCKLCEKIIRSTEKGKFNCIKSDELIGRQNNTGPIIRKCMSAGLWDAGSSISVGGKHIANWLIGQVRNESQDFDEMLKYAKEIGVERETYREALLEVKVMSRKEFEKISNFLFMFSKEISEKAFQNLIQKKYIQERIHAENALKVSEERLRLSLQASKQGLFDINLKTGEVVINEEFAAMLEYNVDDFTSNHNLMSELIHPNDKNRYLKVYNDCVNGDISEFKFEFRCKTSEGEWKWILSLGKTVEYDSFGKPQRILGTHTDINTNKKAEEALQMSYQTFSDVIQSIPSGLFIYQFSAPDKLYLIDGNPEAVKLTGINIKENIGKEFNEIWPNAKQAGITDKYLQVVKTGAGIEMEDIQYSDNKVSGAFRIRPFKMPGLKLGVAFENVSKIKKAENALKESEERYRMLVENQNEYVVKYDSKGILKYASPSYCSLFGIIESEVLETNFSPLVHPEDEVSSKLEKIKLLKYPYTCFFEQRVMTTHEWKWLAWSERAVINNKNEIDFIICVGRDITIRKEAENALSQKTKQTEFLGNFAFRLSEIANSEGIINFLNEQLVSYFNSDLVTFSEYNPKKKVLITRKIDTSYELMNKAVSLLGNKIKNIETPVDEELYKIIIQNKIIAGTTFTEITSGTISPAIDKILRLISGLSKFYGISYVVAGELFGTSVIGLKNNQEEPSADMLKSFAHIAAVSLRRKFTEEKLKVLSRGIEQSHAFVIITDANGSIEYVNPHFCEVTGYDFEYVEGKNPNILKSGYTSHKVYNDLWNNISKGRDWSGEFLNRKRNGELYWQSAIISPIMNENSEITNFIAVNQDITELKKITVDLLAAKEKAEESEKLKTAFLQNMSHEIRTPLNGILGFAQLLKSENLSKDERFNYSVTIQESGKRLIETVENVLDLSKIQTGQVIVNPADVNINDLMENLFSLFKISAEVKGINLIYEKHETESRLILKTDESLITRIFNNLLSNAIKFTNKGYIKFGYFIIENYIEFYVNDTGVGISQQQSQHIFERFYQGDIKLTRNYEGAGLGLAICKSFAEILGGDIRLVSNKEKGSTFYFKVPF